MFASDVEDGAVPEGIDLVLTGVVVGQSTVVRSRERVRRLVVALDDGSLRRRSVVEVAESAVVAEPDVVITGRGVWTREES